MSDTIRKHILEIRFAPDSKILDNRGYISAYLAGKDFDEWNIGSNRINFSSSKNANIMAFFSYRNLGVQTNYPATTKEFTEISENFVKDAWTQFPMNAITRIGVRSSAIIETDNFANAFQKLRDFFVKPPDDELKKLGGDVIDLASSLNFVDGENYFNINIGPMKEEEVQANFGKDVNFASGIYIEVDFFRNEFSPNIKAKKVFEFFDAGIKKIEDLEKQIKLWLKN